MTASHLKALVFDVDGTLAETERAHLAAFNHAFAQEGMDWHWDEARYTELLEISGGKERLLHHWRTTCGEMVDVSGSGVLETVQRLHDLKTAAYEAMINSGAVQLRPGVLDLMEEARTLGLALAIATTTSPVNVAALLRREMGAHWRLNFSVIADASSAPIKKPHPQVYHHVLQAMKTATRDCLAFEDSANGLLAATGAGIATVITPTHFTAHQDFRAALRVLPSLRGVRVRDLQAWLLEAGVRAGALA
jgi:HAD superfamily hydrolase (TIGR01509 family)